ncbi:hypothetical protein UFOVP393_57 [uncultured Caudovirales phage]|uniref:Uncharacterized protein n=1 Tax=uncultured Caudovirales phage TaxID=2100421 RepID=A0A6J7XAE1_9CAUD|nr:hypothetical protein UFOVP393_57 [uncultured Caudovirales phage]
MTPEQIRDLYDRNLSMTLEQLMRITGLSISQLKKILIS